MRRLVPWALALSAVLLGYLAHSPYLMKIRPLELPLLLALVVLALKLARPRRVAIAALCALAVFLALGQEIAFERARARVERAPTAQLARLGRHVVVGYPDRGTAERWIAEGRLGGIFVAPRNARKRSVAELSEEIEALRSLGVRWVAADQEGGLVSRLSPPLDALPPLSTLTGDLDQVTAYGERQGADLRALGVNLNLAPVLDLPAPGRDPGIDLHTKLEARALGTDPERVGAIGVAYASGLARHGVMATFKHFPGLGRVDEDTHHFDARLDAPIELLYATDWAPFRATSARSSGAVMVGHVRVDAVDGGRIATRSRAVIQGVLRDGLGHGGLVITDDLCMAPAFRGPGGVGAAAVDAIRAGVDLLLVSYDPEQWIVVMAALLDADDAGLLSEPLAASMLRLEVARASLERPSGEAIGWLR